MSFNARCGGSHRESSLRLQSEWHVARYREDACIHCRRGRSGRCRSDWIGRRPVTRNDRRGLVREENLSYFIQISNELFEIKFQGVIHLMDMQDIHISSVDHRRFQSFQFVLQTIHSVAKKVIRDDDLLSAVSSDVVVQCHFSSLSPDWDVDANVRKRLRTLVELWAFAVPLRTFLCWSLRRRAAPTIAKATETVSAKRTAGLAYSAVLIGFFQSDLLQTF